MVVESTRIERVILAAIVFSVLYAQVLLYPGIDGLVVSLGLGEGIDAGMWFLAAEFAAFIIFAAIWGVISDAYAARKQLIVIGAIGGAVGYLSIAILPIRLELGFYSVILLRIFQGAMTIGAFSLAITMLMDLTDSHGKDMGAAGLAIGLGVALGAPMGGFIYEIDTFAPLYIAAFSLTLTGLLTLLVRDRTQEGGRDIRQIIGGIQEKPELFIPYSFGFIDRFTAGFFALVGTFFIIETFGLSPSQTGITLFFFFAPFALLQYPFGKLSDSIGRFAPIVTGSIMYGSGIILVGLSDSLIEARVFMLLVGILGALVAPATMALVTDMVPESRYGFAMGGFNIFGSLGFLTGILLGGTLADNYGYLSAFIAAGLSEVLIALVLFPVLYRYLKRSGEDDLFLR